MADQTTKGSNTNDNNMYCPADPATYWKIIHSNKPTRMIHATKCARLFHNCRSSFLLIFSSIGATSSTPTVSPSHHTIQALRNSASAKLPCIISDKTPPVAETIMPTIAAITNSRMSCGLSKEFLKLKCCIMDAAMMGPSVLPTAICAESKKVEPTEKLTRNDAR